MSDDEIFRLWSGDIAGGRPVLGSRKVLDFARAVERAARAAEREWMAAQCAERLTYCANRAEWAAKDAERTYWSAAATEAKILGDRVALRARAEGGERG
jgi:hypothetical protein